MKGTVRSKNRRCHIRPGVDVATHKKSRSRSWSAAACVLGVLFSTDDDVSPKSGAPLLIPLSKDTAPGEVVKWSAAIDAPTGEGKYTMSYDLRCAGAWFEDANNIVYKDAVEVVAKRDF